MKKFREESGCYYRSNNSLTIASVKLRSLDNIGIGNIAKYDSADELNGNTSGVPNISEKNFAFCKDLADYLYEKEQENEK